MYSRLKNCISLLPGHLIAVASLAVEHGLCGVQASVVVVRGLRCSVAGGIFPDQGSNLCFLNWQVDSVLLSHQGSPFSCILQPCRTHFVCFVDSSKFPHKTVVFILNGVTSFQTVHVLFSYCIALSRISNAVSNKSNNVDIFASFLIIGGKHSVFHH